MSRSRGRPLLLGCSAQSLALLALPMNNRAPVECLSALALPASAPGGTGALCRALRALKPESSPATTRLPFLVTLDDGLVRSFLVTPAKGARSLRELKECAALRYAALYGEPADDWAIAADWQASSPFIACALPGELLQTITAVAAANGWRLHSVTPALVRVWNRVAASIPGNGWLLVGFAHTLTLVHTCSDQVAGVRTVRFPETTEALTTLIEQERLRTPARGAARDRQTLSWVGAAEWLPAAGTFAGLPSFSHPLPAPPAAFAALDEAQQHACRLALAALAP